MVIEQQTGLIQGLILMRTSDYSIVKKSIEGLFSEFSKVFPQTRLSAQRFQKKIAV